MKIIPTKIDGENNFQSFSFQLENDADFVEFYTCSFVEFTIDISGITADEIKVSGAVSTTSSNFHQILDETGANPFTQNGLQNGVCSPFGKIKITKTGSTNTILGEISFRKR